MLIYEHASKLALGNGTEQGCLGRYDAVHKVYTKFAKKESGYADLPPKFRVHYTYDEPEFI